MGEGDEMKLTELEKELLSALRLAHYWMEDDAPKVAYQKIAKAIANAELKESQT